MHKLNDQCSDAYQIANVAHGSNGLGAQRMDSGELHRGDSGRRLTLAQIETAAAERLAQLEQENAELRAQLRERDEAIAQARFALDHDPASGLPTREVFLERLKQALQHARLESASLAVIAFEIRDLNAGASSLDRAAQARLLAAIAFRIRSHLKPMELLARIDDDLLVVMLPHVGLEGLQLKQYAERVATRTQDALLTEVWFDGMSYPVASGIAVALSPHEGDSAFELLHRVQADLGRVASLGPQDATAARVRRRGSGLSGQIETGLREALENDLLLPYFQPQVSGIDGPCIVGAEALARWPLSDGRFISPSVFVPAADAAGLTYALDDAVFTAVCSRLASWQLFEPRLRIAVNISEARFHSPDLVARVRDVVRNTGANPQCLLFEVTESVLITDFDAAKRTLGAIRDLGIAVALDDFGTGYSSLSYLRKLPLDAIKIDQSFVRELDGERDVAVIRAIIAMAQSLHLQVIAEGVETAQQAETLSELGCPVLQGFLYSEAVSAAEFEALLRRAAPMVPRV